jgi:kynurenine formamidase
MHSHAATQRRPRRRWSFRLTKILDDIFSVIFLTRCGAARGVAPPRCLLAKFFGSLKRYNTGEPGVGVEGAKYLVSKGVVAVGSDTWAVEVLPFESKDVFPVHQIFLPMSGTYILENMNTDQLAADKGYEFLFVLGVPKITGSVQAIINPVAIR